MQWYLKYLKTKEQVDPLTIYGCWEEMVIYNSLLACMEKAEAKTSTFSLSSGF
jgi:hypothetical protein